MSNRKYKGILLDLDNTLYDYPPMHKAALDTVLAEISRVIDVSTATLEGMYCRAQAVGKQRLEGKAASHSRILYIQWMLESLGIFSYRFALDLENLYWNTFLDTMTLLPGMEEFLRRAMLPICIVTDLTATIQMRKIIRLGIAPQVRFMVSSEESGVEKPHPFIFWCAVRKLGLTPEECVMIGDSYEKDILGAVGAGVDAILFRAASDALALQSKPEEHPGVYCARDGRDLLALIENNKGGGSAL